MAAEYQMRVSDAEREAAAAELREHFAAGRLDSDELDERLAAAFAARTRGDLTALFADLPSAGSGRPSPLPAGGARSFGPGAFGPGAFGAGAFGAGPFGPGASGAGPFGAGAGRGRPGSGPGGGGDWRVTAGRTVARAVLASVLMVALLTTGLLGVFGIGSGRPFGLVLLFAALALLRRLIFVLTGRGRRRGRCGPRRGGPRRRS